MDSTSVLPTCYASSMIMIIIFLSVVVIIIHISINVIAGIYICIIAIIVVQLL